MLQVKCASIAFLHLNFLISAAYALNCAGTSVALSANAIFVSPQGSDSGTCGRETSAPCKSIEEGIKNCKTAGDGCAVYVRYGVYSLSDPLKLGDGISLYGSCIFDETGYRYRSIVIASPYAALAYDLKKETLLYGFVLVGSSMGLKPGDASYGFVLQNSTGVKLRNDVIVSGSGKAGANGLSASQGQKGNQGSQGDGSTGGAGGKAGSDINPLDGKGRGGNGANHQMVHSGGCNYGLCDTCENNNYSVAEAGQNSGSSIGGAGGQNGRAGCACRNRSASTPGTGATGAEGKPGSCSVTGGTPDPDIRGGFTNATWIGTVGGSGVSGGVGAGGGGGGAGGFGVNPKFGNTDDYAGYAGGGGGGGGSGGSGGEGGRSGGASIVLILENASSTALDQTVTLIPASGGQGGNGGSGGTGGAGGMGASVAGRGSQSKVSTAICEALVPGRGGEGGTGGVGGGGGGGAGGNGGPSFAVALVDSPPSAITAFSLYKSQPGAGGLPGLGAQNSGGQCKAADGRAGLTGYDGGSESIVSFPRRLRNPQ